MKELANLDDLAAELGAVPGLRIEKNAELRRLNTLKVGGRAELLARVESTEALSALLAATAAAGVPRLVLGHGANVLVPDEGLPGVVFRLEGELRQIELLADEGRVRAGAGAAMAQVARRAARAGFFGLEALAGFPASVGGAVRMNAGCYGVETVEVLQQVAALDAGGGEVELLPEDLDAGYRHTSIAARGLTVVGATFRLEPGDAEEAVARMEELNRRRWESLPSGKPNAGSVFKNPDGDHAGRLLEAAGAKGLRVGGAAISEKHANVIVNLGEATARDVLRVMAEGRRRVFEESGVRLEAELLRLGGLEEAWGELEPW